MTPEEIKKLDHIAYVMDQIRVAGMSKIYTAMGELINLMGTIEDSAELRKQCEGLFPTDYIAANLFEALKIVPDTGDWHGQLRAWCERWKGETLPNKTADEMMETIALTLHEE